ncbi:helix-turn-helix domain-containing protein [Nocardia sp. NPDC004860]|uniref:helix-turn-helix domain-containing protein n=1 Tax=Nocardia sp. NPDC004860 TaxID=3154557 RepID=UPI0033AB7AD3
MALLITTSDLVRAHDSIHVEPHNFAETFPPQTTSTIPIAKVPADGAEGSNAVCTSGASSADGTSTPSWSELATVICSRDAAGRRDPAEVAQILALHFDDGWNTTQIAAHIRRSRSTVSRIVGDTVRLQPGLCTTGAL